MDFQGGHSKFDWGLTFFLEKPGALENWLKTQNLFDLKFQSRVTKLSLEHSFTCNFKYQLLFVVNYSI